MKRQVSFVLVLAMLVVFCLPTNVLANYYNSGYYNSNYSNAYDDGYNDGYEIGYEDGYSAGERNSYWSCYDEAFSSGYGNSEYTKGKIEGYEVGYDAGFYAACPRYQSVNYSYNDSYDYDYESGYNYSYDDAYQSNPQNWSSRMNYNELYNQGYNDSYSAGYTDGCRAGQKGSHGAYYYGLADFEVGDSPYRLGACEGYHDGYMDGFDEYYSYDDYSYDDYSYDDDNSSNRTSNSTYNNVSYSYSSKVSSDVTINGETYHYEDSYQTNDLTEPVNRSYEFSVTYEYTPVCEQPQYVPPTNNYGYPGSSVPTNNSSYGTRPAGDLYSDLIYYNDFKPQYMDVSKDCKSHITALEDSNAVRSLKKGTTLYITGQCSNKYNNVWYVVNNGNEYVYGGNLKSHSHTMKDVKTEVGAFKVCKDCGYYTANTTTGTKLASVAMLAVPSLATYGNSINGAVAAGAGVAAVDGPLPFGDIVAIGIVAGSLFYTSTKAIPTVAELVETATAEATGRQSDGPYRKVSRATGQNLKYIDNINMDIQTADLYILAGGDVYCKTYYDAFNLASKGGRQCYMEIDKNKTGYYYHFHIKDSNGKKLNCHIFFGKGAVNNAVPD